MKIVRPVGDQNIWGKTVQDGAYAFAYLGEVTHLTIREADKLHLSTQNGRATRGLLPPYRVRGRRHVDDERLIAALDMLADRAPGPDLSVIRMGHNRRQSHVHALCEDTRNALPR